MFLEYASVRSTRIYSMHAAHETLPIFELLLRGTFVLITNKFSCLAPIDLSLMLVHCTDNTRATVRLPPPVQTDQLPPQSQGLPALPSYGLQGDVVEEIQEAGSINAGRASMINGRTNVGTIHAHLSS